MITLESSLEGREIEYLSCWEDGGKTCKESWKLKLGPINGKRAVSLEQLR